jgi:diguanylate cyclase
VPSEDLVPRSLDLVVTSERTIVSPVQLVAEDVETPAAALTLMQHGYHRAQGFLLSRPVPGKAMEASLSAPWMPMPFLADREALSLGAI